MLKNKFIYIFNVCLLRTFFAYILQITWEDKQLVNVSYHIYCDDVMFCHN